MGCIDLRHPAKAAAAPQPRRLSAPRRRRACPARSRAASPRRRGSASSGRAGYPWTSTPAASSKRPSATRRRSSGRRPWGSPGTTLATTHTLTVRVFKPRANAAAQIAAFKKEAAGLPDARVAKLGSYARWTSGVTGAGVMFLASGYECQVSFVNQASLAENLGRAGEIVSIAKFFAARLK